MNFNPDTLFSHASQDVAAGPEQRALEAFARRHRFSPRETQVLRLGAAGLSKPATAQALGCSYHTVVTHWRRMAVKLDARNRQEVLDALAAAREDARAA